MADIIEKNGKEYYSEDYVKDQIQNAFRAGVSSGAKIKVSFMLFNDKHSENTALEILNRKVHEKFLSDYYPHLIFKFPDQHTPFNTFERE